MKTKLKLLDCGKASKKTKGALFTLWFEVGAPPWDRMFMGF